MKLKQYDPKHLFKTKLRKGDEVIVLTGKSRGEIGTIDQIDKKSGRVYLAGKNLAKKHQKPDLAHQEGGILDVPAPLHISNVAIVDPKTKKATRLGFKIDGKSKVRVARKSGQALQA